MSEKSTAERLIDLETTVQRPPSVNRLIPLVRWNDFHIWPPIGGLRHLAFFRATNGFNKAFIKIGRRILIDEAEFLKQIRNQNEAAQMQDQR